MRWASGPSDVYLEDSRVEIDNNLVENAIRPTAHVAQPGQLPLELAVRRREAGAGFHRSIEAGKLRFVKPVVCILTMTHLLPRLPLLAGPVGPAHRRRLRATLAQLQQHLRDFLPAPLLATEDDGVNSRERVFSLRLTLECFLWQMLKPRTSCREVVRQVQALFRLDGLAPVDEGDSAYVQARQRLPRERLEKALAATAQAADRRVERSAQLQGRTVKVVDGSTTQLADTPENQKRFPQPSSQKPGCGFPVIRFIALLSLTSGAMLQVVWDSLRSHDLRLFRHLWPHLQTGDIVLGDRAFGEYTTAAALPRQGVDLVARLHHQRKVDFRKAKRLAKNDGLFGWAKGYQQSRILSAAEWALLPAQITVRLIRFTATIRGWRDRRVTLVTTLLDANSAADQLASLYRRWRRWNYASETSRPPWAWNSCAASHRT